MFVLFKDPHVRSLVLRKLAIIAAVYVVLFVVRGANAQLVLCDLLWYPIYDPILGWSCRNDIIYPYVKQPNGIIGGTPNGAYNTYSSYGSYPYLYG